MRASSILLALLLAGCREDHAQRLGPVQEVCSEDACGTMIATGPFWGLTAGHVADGPVEMHGVSGRVALPSPSDESPAAVSFSGVSFASFYGTAAPVTGPATYLSLRGAFPIFLEDDRSFTGSEPVPGDSGSGVLQGGLVVGVLTHSTHGGGIFAAVRQ